MKTFVITSVVCVISCLFFFASCSKDQHSLKSENGTSGQVHSDKKSKILKGYYKGKLINYQRVNGINIVEGDIVVADDQISDTPSFNSNYAVITEIKANWWPKKTIYYTFKTDSVDGWPLKPAQVDLVKKAIKHWDESTVINFVPRTDQENYVEFAFNSMSDDCLSPIGIQGNGKQNIWLADRCGLGSIIHEIGHTVGLHHEHNAPDRDYDITINYDNIIPEYIYAFEKESHEFTISNYFVDFNSIMMYGSHHFSKNGQPTMVKKDGTTFPHLEERPRLSKSDTSIVALVYRILQEE